MRSYVSLSTLQLAYEVIWLSMAKEDGAGRDEANPQQVDV